MNKRLSLTYRMKTILIRLKKVEWYINQTVYTVGGNWDMKKTGIILGALLLAAGLTGCGGEKKEEATLPIDSQNDKHHPKARFDSGSIVCLE